MLTTAALVTASISTPISSDGTTDTRPVRRAHDVRKREENHKYFHEPGGDMNLGHYDARYFHEVVSDQERTDTQSHMIRAYLDFFREHNLDTWIAHGTLLGWWWNGKRLPWDYDLDTQVADATLHHLGEVYNQTKYQYASADGTVQREYLLDVNPWIWERERGDGANIIDARWIDTRNGLFVDITGLSEIHPDTHPGIWSCKNYHMYRTDELYPMRETMFEGVRAKVPYDYDKILIDEYQEKALIETNFNGHRWDTQLREWVQTEETRAKKEKERKEKEEAKEKEKLEQAKLD